MRNIYLDDLSNRDIDRTISKVLKDLGDPEPPLSLEAVRDLLDLDRQYYSSSDPSFLDQTVHRMRLGVKQVVKRPSLLLDVVKKLEIKALWLSDDKRILIDEDLAKPKHRWSEAHEIGHSLIEWHEDMVHGDQLRTLSRDCEIRLEAEANYAAGRLLFLQDQFGDRLMAGALNYDRIKTLSKEFKNTQTSTLWRAIETLDTAAFGLISQRPRRDLVDPSKPLVRYFLRSRVFEVMFDSVSEADIYHDLQSFCWGRKGPLGADEVVLTDTNGGGHVFKVECFYNGHDALTFGVYEGASKTVVRVS